MTCFIIKICFSFHPVFKRQFGRLYLQERKLQGEKWGERRPETSQCSVESACVQSFTGLKSRERTNGFTVQQNNESQGSACPSNVLHTSSRALSAFSFCHISITKQHLLSLKCKDVECFRAPSVLPVILFLHFWSPLSSSLWQNVSVFPLAAILQCCWSPPPSACNESSWRILLDWCRSPLSAVVSCAQWKAIRV